VWREAVLDTNLLCNTDADLELRLDVMKIHQSGNNTLIGSKTFTLNQLKNGEKNLGAAQIMKFAM
jgi:hypothetical protein